MKTQHTTHPIYLETESIDSLTLTTFLYGSSDRRMFERCLKKCEIHHALSASDFITRSHEDLEFLSWLQGKHNHLKRESMDAESVTPFIQGQDHPDTEWMIVKMQEELIEVYLAFEGYRTILLQGLYTQHSFEIVRKFFLKLLCEVSDLLCIYYINEDFTAGPPLNWRLWSSHSLNRLIASFKEHHPERLNQFLDAIMISLDVFMMYITEHSDKWYSDLAYVKALLCPNHAGKIMIIENNGLANFSPSKIEKVQDNILNLAAKIIDRYEGTSYRTEPRELVWPQYQ